MAIWILAQPPQRARGGGRRLRAVLTADDTDRPALGRCLATFLGLLVVAGGYIVLFWAFELANITAGPMVAAVVLFVERVSSRFTNAIGDRPLLWGAVFVLIVATSVAASVRAHRRGRREKRAVERSTR